MSTLPETIAPAQAYGVELLYQAPPHFSADKLLKALGEQAGTVESVAPGEGNDLGFAFPDIQDPERDDGKPVMVVIAVRKGAVPEAESDDALLQTRDWIEARDCVQRHTARVAVADQRAAGLPYKNRLRLFQDILLAIFDCAPPVAIYWKPSGKIVSPWLLQEALRNGKPDRIHGAVNVRCMPASKAPGTQVVDTLGLAALGLPDLECTFKGRDPARMSAFIRATSRYMFDLGNVIEDGRIFRGSDAGERWVAGRARSVEPPARPVIRLKPA